MSFKRWNIIIFVISMVALLLTSTGRIQAQSSDFFIPQVVDGGGFRTLFTVTNLSASTGAPFSIQATFDPAFGGGPGTILSIPGQTGGQSSAALTVAPGGQITISTIGAAGGVKVGWAKISSSSSVGVSAVFLVVDGNGNVTSAAGILPQPSQATFTVIGMIKTSAKTGVAVLNPSAVDAHATFKLLDTNGAQTSTDKTITIPAGTKIAQFFDEGSLFVGVTNFDGSVAISSDVALQVLSLRLDFPSGNVATLPNLPGRTGVPLQHADATFSWIDATPAAGGTRISLGTDPRSTDVNGQTTAIAFPFPITMYGKTYGNTPFDQMFISEDGWVSMGTGFAATPTALPSATLPPALVAPFFADFHYDRTNANVGVFGRVDGTLPNRHFTIEWTDVSFVNSALGTTARFEVVFFEGTSDIKFQYQVVGNNPGGAGIVVGIQDDTRTQAVSVDRSTNPPGANKAKTFQYFGGSSYTLVQN
ncbi:MAG: hypothetical protein ACHQKY_00600 [Terriglobia bacterium]